MRKIIVYGLLMGTMALTLCGCSSKSSENGDGSEKVKNSELSTMESESTTQEATSATTEGESATQEVTSATTESESTTQEASSSTMESTEITEEQIRSLMKENLNCMDNIFVLGTLPRYDEPVEGDNIYQVDEKVFADYATFENYVKSVYCTETADIYLNNYPYEGQSKYINRDGKLYVNMDFDGGKGYYVDWSEYTVVIDSVSETECNFTLTAVVEWPAENPVKEPYEVKGTAVFENGKWVLKEMLS